MVPSCPIAALINLSKVTIEPTHTVPARPLNITAKAWDEATHKQLPFYCQNILRAYWVSSTDVLD